MDAEANLEQRGELLQQSFVREYPGVVDPLSGRGWRAGNGCSQRCDRTCAENQRLVSTTCQYPARWIRWLVGSACSPEDTSGPFISGNLTGNTRFPGIKQEGDGKAPSETHGTHPSTPDSPCAAAYS